MTQTRDDQPANERRTADEKIQLLEDAIDRFNEWAREKQKQRKQRAQAAERQEAGQCREDMG